MLWGDAATVSERLQRDFKQVHCTRRELVMVYPMTPPEAVEYFRTWYGPTQRAFAALDQTGQAALRRDLETFWTQHNTAADGTTRIVAEYLEVTALRAY